MHSSKTEKLESESGMEENQVQKILSKPINSLEIKKRIQKTLENNTYLSEKLANVRTNLNSLYKDSKNDNFEISKRQEKSKQVRKDQDDGEMTPNFASRLPTLDSLNLPLPDGNRDEDKDYYETISKLLSNSSQPQATQLNQVAAQLTPDIELLLKSMVMQDLFTSAFKRLLHTSKPTILHNLNNSLGFKMDCPPPMPMNIIRRNSKAKRKNTDPMSSDTIESDINANLAPSFSHRAHKFALRNQTSLSAFFQHSKNRSNSMAAPVHKQEGQNWDPREEKKQ